MSFLGYWILALWLLLWALFSAIIVIEFQTLLSILYESLNGCMQVRPGTVAGTGMQQEQTVKNP